jgi:hypothetical protein
MQLSFLKQPAQVAVGRRFDALPSTTRSLRSAELIEAGSLVARSADGVAKLPSLVGDLIVGVVVMDENADRNSAGNSVGYVAGKMMPVQQTGTVGVVATTSFVEGGQVFVRYAGAGAKGTVSNALVGGETVAVPGARFYLSGSAGPCVVQLGVF